MAGTTLRDAMQADVDCTDRAALENLVTSLVYKINGSNIGSLEL